jgi:hypothetical protein
VCVCIFVSTAVPAPRSFVGHPHHHPPNDGCAWQRELRGEEKKYGKGGGRVLEKSPSCLDWEGDAS